MTLEKIIGAKVSMGVKKDAVDVDTFLYRLYNDEDSPLYHGFIFEMRENMFASGSIFDRKSIRKGKDLFPG